MTVDQLARLNLLVLWPLTVASIAAVLPLLSRRFGGDPAERGLLATYLSAGAFVGCGALAVSLLLTVGRESYLVFADFSVPDTLWQLRLGFDRPGGVAIVLLILLAGAMALRARAELREPLTAARLALILGLVLAALVVVALPALALVWAVGGIVLARVAPNRGGQVLLIASALATSAGLLLLSRLTGEGAPDTSGVETAVASGGALRLSALLVFGGLIVSAGGAPLHGWRPARDPSASGTTLTLETLWTGAALFLLVRVATLWFGPPYGPALVLPIALVGVGVIWVGSVLAVVSPRPEETAWHATAAAVGWVVLALTPIVRGHTPAAAYLLVYFLLLAMPALTVLARSPRSRPVAPVLALVVLAGWMGMPGTLGFLALTRTFAAVVQVSPLWAWLGAAVFPVMAGYTGRLAWQWWTAPPPRSSAGLIPLATAAVGLLAGAVGYTAVVRWVTTPSG